MRGFVTVVVAVVASFPVSAQAAESPSLSISVSASKVLYGHGLTLSGRLSSGAAGRQIAIFSRPLGQLTMRRLGKVETVANGGWELRVKPGIATSYEARAGSVVTPLLSVGVVPALVTRVLANGAVWAHVAGGRSFAGRSVELQRATGSGWMTEEKATLDKHSDGVFDAPVARGSAMLRVAIGVNEVGRGFLGGSSAPFAYRALGVSISAPSLSASFGRPLELSGRLSNGRPGQTVTISAKRYGSSAITLSKAVSGAAGRWLQRVEPTIETSYQARWDGLSSRVLVIGVRPAVAVTQLGGRLAVSFAPVRAFLGRSVELQQLTAGRWKTIDQLALTGPTGNAVFPPPIKAGSATLRIAMSVNEAGVGYLGTTSPPLTYHTRFVSIAPAAYKVLDGQALTLSGLTSTRQSGEQVVILARIYGHPAPTLAATVTTGAGGRWSFRAAPTVETSYTARWGTSESRPITVGVEPRVTVTVLGSGLIETHLSAGRPLAGRTIELQELTAAKLWSTIMRTRLNRRASAVLQPPATAARSTLRIAISVNQAGAGLLGATSHTFVDHNA